LPVTRRRWPKQPRQRGQSSAGGPGIWCAGRTSSCQGGAHNSSKAGHAFCESAGGRSLASRGATCKAGAHAAAAHGSARAGGARGARGDSKVLLGKVAACTVAVLAPPGAAPRYCPSIQALRTFCEIPGRGPATPEIILCLAARRGVDESIALSGIEMLSSYAAAGAVNVTATAVAAQRQTQPT
jgi:hypothetical protein